MLTTCLLTGVVMTTNTQFRGDALKKVWLNRYPADVPADINPDRYQSLVELFEHATARYADQPAFVNMGEVMTFRKLEERSRAFAAYLQQGLGLQKGDRVALMMPNLLQYPVALFGILRAGMIVVNVNPLYTPRELEHQLNDSGASAIVIVSNFAHTLEKVVDKTQVRHVILTRMGDQLSPAKGTLVNFVVKYVKRLVPKYHLPDAISFRRALQAGYRLQYIKPEVTTDDLAFLQYTGGTTGVAKGAMLTHRNMLANLEQVNATYGPLLHRGKELVVTALPLYHIFALTMNCLLFIELGGQNLLITNPRDIPGLVKELAKYPFTAMTGVNTLFNALLNNDDFHKLDFSSLHLSAGGGMPVQQAVAERWVKLTGEYLLEGYGLTECSPLVSVNPHDIDYHSGSIGLPVPSTEVKLVDDEGNEVPPGEPGELCVKGPQVMLGYWQRPAATDEIIKDGWLTNPGPMTLRIDKDTADAVVKDNMAASAAINWLRYMEISHSWTKINLDNLGVLTMQATVTGNSRVDGKVGTVNLNYTHEENVFTLWRSLRFGDNLQAWLEQNAALPETHCPEGKECEEQQ